MAAIREVMSTGLHYVTPSTTVGEAVAAAQKKGCRRPVITRMPRAIRSFVGFHRAS